MSVILLFFTGSDNDCNTEDNDCDGSLDEGYIGSAYSCGSGVCRATGFRACIDGDEGGGDCFQIHLATSDANCNGSDDDCNGRTDEHYSGSNTTCGRGVCRRTGRLSCAGGSVVNSCVAGNPTGSDNTFNNLDDDCDGRTDESACTFVSSNDDCNGNDDDCDGRVDEDFSSYSNTCGVGVCASTGTVTCSNGSEVSSCSPNNGNASADNSCDGVDNDCDDRVDEAYVGGLSTCGVGACYREGTFDCVSGLLFQCVAGSPTQNHE